MQADAADVAERIRSLLIAEALAAYEDAGIRGLCHEGAWEAAIVCLRRLDLTPALTERSPAELQRVP